MKNKIGVVGSCGMVGGAVKRFFQKDDTDLFLYDKYQMEGSIKEVNKADYIFSEVK